MPQPQIPPAEKWAWKQLKDWTQATTIILNKILVQLTGPNSPITPELERAINKTTAITLKIDRKVPDNACENPTGSDRPTEQS